LEAPEWLEIVDDILLLGEAKALSVPMVSGGAVFLAEELFALRRPDDRLALGGDLKGVFLGVTGA